MLGETSLDLGETAGDADRSIVGVQYHDVTSGTSHTDHLGKPSRRVGQVLEDTFAPARVEEVVVERQRCGIGLLMHHLSGNASGVRPLIRLHDHFQVEVDAVDVARLTDEASECNGVRTRPEPRSSTRCPSCNSISS